MLLRLPSAASMAASAMRRAAVPTADPHHSSLGCQARFATKVAAFNKKRKNRNPWGRHIKQVQFHEDTRMKEFWQFHDHWRYELRAWKKKFQDVKDQRISKYETVESKIPLNKPMYITFALNAWRKGWPKYLLKSPTMKDNPYVGKANNKFQFERHKKK
eukprot:TRINITY_DN341_c7_g1_i1.p1 TRINITY_DN341_c7_g1~~TRINITY_DN341_c7_g1_i1.p1  ORF type:complete len:170 (+),score=25.09 TRINITY_DN341_c7_g1_i1:35-511(+)